MDRLTGHKLGHSNAQDAFLRTRVHVHTYTPTPTPLMARKKGGARRRTARARNSATAAPTREPDTKPGDASAAAPPESRKKVGTPGTRAGPAETTPAGTSTRPPVHPRAPHVFTLDI